MENLVIADDGKYYRIVSTFTVKVDGRRVRGASEGLVPDFDRPLTEAEVEAEVADPRGREQEFNAFVREHPAMPPMPVLTEAQWQEDEGRAEAGLAPIHYTVEMASKQAEAKKRLLVTREYAEEQLKAAGIDGKIHATHKGEICVLTDSFVSYMRL